jgi:hypothetical membrane protein
MSPHQIVAVCIRLASVFWLLYVISHSYGLFAYLDSGVQLSLNKPTAIFFTSLQLATCAVLWFFSAGIAAILLPSSRATTDLTPPSLMQWQALGLICIGIFGLSRSIPDAVYWITFLNMAASSAEAPISMTAEQTASVISTVIEIGIGVWLVVGSKKLTAFIQQMRTAGVAK